MSLLIGAEDTGYVTTEHRLTNLLCLCFRRSFVLLFRIVLHQLCLLHQVGAKNAFRQHENDKLVRN